MYVLKVLVPKLQKDTAHQFETCVEKIGGVHQVDTWPGRAELQLADKGVVTPVLSALTLAGWVCVEEGVNVKTHHSGVSTVQIDGMTCQSCEVTIERKLKTIPGVEQVDVNVSTGVARMTCAANCVPTLETMQEKIGLEKYAVRGFVHENKPKQKQAAQEFAQRPTIGRLIGIFALVLFVGFVFSRIGIFDLSSRAGNATSFFPAVLLGLVAGTSSCLAVAGGLLLTSAAKFKERYGQLTGSARLRPVYLFVAGRVLSYGIFGGLIGLIGQAFTPSPLITSFLIILAATYMIIMGFDMLKLTPPWLKRWMPRMPKSLSHKILNAENKDHPAMPLLLGGATFFLPCGFTQALQLYALTTGSFVKSALILGGFAIGTAPMLFALGWASNSFKGKAGKFFFQFSGALVIILGLFNIQNGLASAGYPLSFPSISLASTSVATEDGGGSGEPDVNVKDEAGTQVITMRLISSSPYYSPSDQYTVKAGLPVRLEINGVGTGCRSLFQIPQLGVALPLQQESNVVEFTPTSPGNYTFSCGMGMYRGTLRVI